jgi:hypothetical protein
MATKQLRVGTHNLSIAAVKRHPDQVKSNLKKLLNEFDVIGLQESGAAEHIINAVCKETGHKVFYGFGKTGQASDPILYRKELDVVDKRSFPLTGRVFMGARGAGARLFSKPKFLLVLTIKFNGKTVHVANQHVTPSIFIPIRFRLASKQIRRASAAVNQFHGPKFITGDFNAVVGHRIFGPFRNTGLHSANKASGTIPTHGSRAIDDVWYKNAVLVEHKHWNDVSDHDVFGGVFEV